MRNAIVKEDGTLLDGQARSFGMLSGKKKPRTMGQINFSPPPPPKDLASSGNATKFALTAKPLPKSTKGMKFSMEIHGDDISPGRLIIPNGQDKNLYLVSTRPSRKVGYSILYQLEGDRRGTWQEFSRKDISESFLIVDKEVTPTVWFYAPAPFPASEGNQEKSKALTPKTLCQITINGFLDLIETFSSMRETELSRRQAPIGPLAILETARTAMESASQAYDIGAIGINAFRLYRCVAQELMIIGYNALKAAMTIAVSATAPGVQDLVSKYQSYIGGLPDRVYLFSLLLDRADLRTMLDISYNHTYANAYPDMLETALETIIEAPTSPDGKPFFRDAKKAAPYVALAKQLLPGIEAANSGRRQATAILFGEGSSPGDVQWAMGSIARAVEVNLIQTKSWLKNSSARHMGVRTCQPLLTMSGLEGNLGFLGQGMGGRPSQSRQAFRQIAEKAKERWDSLLRDARREGRDTVGAQYNFIKDIIDRAGGTTWHAALNALKNINKARLNSVDAVAEVFWEARDLPQKWKGKSRSEINADIEQASLDITMWREEAANIHNRARRESRSLDAKERARLEEIDSLVTRNEREVIVPSEILLTKSEAFVLREQEIERVLMEERLGKSPKRMGKKNFDSIGEGHAEWLAYYLEQFFWSLKRKLGAQIAKEGQLKSVEDPVTGRKKWVIADAADATPKISLEWEPGSNQFNLNVGKEMGALASKIPDSLMTALDWTVFLREFAREFSTKEMPFDLNNFQGIIADQIFLLRKKVATVDAKIDRTAAGTKDMADLQKEHRVLMEELGKEPLLPTEIAGSWEVAHIPKGGAGLLKVQKMLDYAIKHEQYMKSPSGEAARASAAESDAIFKNEREIDLEQNREADNAQTASPGLDQLVQDTAEAFARGETKGTEPGPTTTKTAQETVKPAQEKYDQRQAQARTNREEESRQGTRDQRGTDPELKEFDRVIVEAAGYIKVWGESKTVLLDSLTATPSEVIQLRKAHQTGDVANVDLIPTALKEETVKARAEFDRTRANPKEITVKDLGKSRSDIAAYWEENQNPSRSKSSQQLTSLYKYAKEVVEAGNLLKAEYLKAIVFTRSWWRILMRRSFKYTWAALKMAQSPRQQIELNSQVRKSTTWFGSLFIALPLQITVLELTNPLLWAIKLWPGSGVPTFVMGSFVWKIWENVAGIFGGITEKVLGSINPKYSDPRNNQSQPPKSEGIDWITLGGLGLLVGMVTAPKQTFNFIGKIFGGVATATGAIFGGGKKGRGRPASKVEKQSGRGAPVKVEDWKHKLRIARAEGKKGAEKNAVNALRRASAQGQVVPESMLHTRIE